MEETLNHSDACEVLVSKDGAICGDRQDRCRQDTRDGDRGTVTDRIGGAKIKAVEIAAVVKMFLEKVVRDRIRGLETRRATDDGVEETKARGLKQKPNYSRKREG